MLIVNVNHLPTPLFHEMVPQLPVYCGINRVGSFQSVHWSYHFHDTSCITIYECWMHNILPKELFERWKHNIELNIIPLLKFQHGLLCFPITKLPSWLHIKSRQLALQVAIFFLKTFLSLNSLFVCQVCSKLIEYIPTRARMSH